MTLLCREASLYRVILLEPGSAISPTRRDGHTKWILQYPRGRRHPGVLRKISTALVVIKMDNRCRKLSAAETLQMKSQADALFRQIYTRPWPKRL